MEWQDLVFFFEWTIPEFSVHAFNQAMELKLKDIKVYTSMCACGEADLITVDHNVVCGDEGFEQDHPAGVGGALEQRVGQLRDVHIHLIGAMDQTCKTKMKESVCL